MDDKEIVSQATVFFKLQCGHFIDGLLERNPDQWGAPCPFCNKWMDEDKAGKLYRPANAHNSLFRPLSGS